VPNQFTSGNLALAGFNDIFNVGTADGTQIAEISLSELHAPEFHPFQVNDDSAMQSLVQSITQYGVREPGLARPKEDGGYELLCGNRRKHACELAGLTTMPVIIREMDDDTATITMVDSNLEQREKILPSEKAWAYRIKMEALNHNGVKGDMHSVDILMEQTGDKKNKIFALIRLTELIPDLLDKVDANQLAFNAAVSLSYLSRKEQTMVVDVMGKYEIKPSHSQALRLKTLNKEGKLTDIEIEKILSEEKKSPKVKPISTTQFQEFFPSGYSQAQMEAVIIKLLTTWKLDVAV